MGFLKPKVPKVPPPPTPPNPAQAPLFAKEFNRRGDGLEGFDASLISTGSRGLRRKADTERVSLIGGY